MRSHRPSLPTRPAPPIREGWRIVGIVSIAVATVCLALLAPAVGDALDPRSHGSGGLLAIFAVPTAPLCALLALIAGTVSALRHDRLGVVFAAVGALAATTATVIVTLLGGYGIVQMVVEAAAPAAGTGDLACVVDAPIRRTVDR
ncbi:MAG: hypothetical protein PGN24_03110 [Microbacterium arborescens]